jgi:chromosome segregation ATPase
MFSFGKSGLSVLGNAFESLSQIVAPEEVVEGEEEEEDSFDDRVRRFVVSRRMELESSNAVEEDDDENVGLEAPSPAGSFVSVALDDDNERSDSMVGKTAAQEEEGGRMQSPPPKIALPFDSPERLSADESPSSPRDDWQKQYPTEAHQQLFQEQGTTLLQSLQRECEDWKVRAGRCSELEQQNAALKSCLDDHERTLSAASIAAAQELQALQTAHEQAINRLQENYHEQQSIWTARCDALRRECDGHRSTVETLQRQAALRDEQWQLKEQDWLGLHEELRTASRSHEQATNQCRESQERIRELESELSDCTIRAQAMQVQEQQHSQNTAKLLMQLTCTEEESRRWKQRVESEVSPLSSDVHREQALMDALSDCEKLRLEKSFFEDEKKQLQSEIQRLESALQQSEGSLKEAEEIGWKSKAECAELLWAYEKEESTLRTANATILELQQQCENADSLPSQLVVLLSSLLSDDISSAESVESSATWTSLSKELRDVCMEIQHTIQAGAQERKQLQTVLAVVTSKLHSGSSPFTVLSTTTALVERFQVSVLCMHCVVVDVD